MKIGDQRAFPIPMGGYLTDVGHKCNAAQFGMTYRQWMCGLSFQALLSNHHVTKELSDYLRGRSGHAFPDAIAAAACDAADRMIATMEGK